MITSRRSFLSLLAAPAIVRAGSIMPVRRFVDFPLDRLPAIAPMIHVGEVVSYDPAFSDLIKIAIWGQRGVFTVKRQFPQLFGSPQQGDLAHVDPDSGTIYPITYGRIT